MAARKKAARRKSGRGRKGKTRAQLLRILGKAQGEVAQLLKDANRGIFRPKDLRTGLVEISKNLDDMEPLELWDV